MGFATNDMADICDVIKEIAGDTPLATGVLVYYYIHSLEVTVDGYYKEYKTAFSELHDIAHKVYNAKWYNRWYYERKLGKKKKAYRHFSELYNDSKHKLDNLKEEYLHFLEQI